MIKPEKEVVWLFKLAESKHCGNFLKKPISACKKDFQRFLNAPENDKNFIKWIDELIEEGVLIFSEYIKRTNGGRPISSYVVDFKKLIEKLRNNEYYDSACDFFERRSHMGVIR